MGDLRDKLWHFWMTAKYGYDTTYWIFVVLGSAAVLTQVFGIAGTTAVIVVFLFFYYVGTVNKRAVERYEIRKKAENRKLNARQANAKRKT